MSMGISKRSAALLSTFLFAILFSINSLRSSLTSLLTSNYASFLEDFPKTPKPIKIAFAVTVTACPPDFSTDAAAVLRHSIMRSSVQGTLGGRYDFDCIAFYHPQAEQCALVLGELGWKILQRPVFVNVSDIRGDFLRRNIEKNGCCGEKEYIKLESFTLTEYPLVVHIDLDTLVIKPMDDLFDMMLSPGPVDVDRYKDILMLHKNQSMPQRINAIFTYDYNMVYASTVYKPVQGGFIVVRPDLAVHEEFRQIVLEGDFRNGDDGNGWAGKVGPFYGGQGFQGIVPYYYDVLHPGQSVEINRCVFNQMCDSPFEQTEDGSTEPGKCLTGEAECEDCRARPVEEVVTAHYTICQKPWWCHAHAANAIEHRLCRALMHEWFRARSELEQSWGLPGMGEGTYEKEVFLGFCNAHGREGYLPIQKPDGLVILA